MKRRTFLGVAGITIGNAAAQAEAAALAPSSTTTLYLPAKNGKDVFVRCGISGQNYVCLHGDAMARSLTATATGPDGTLVWEQPLPAGIYGAVGGGGQYVGLLYAVTYRPAGGGVELSTVFSVGPGAEAVNKIGSLPTSSSAQIGAFVNGSTLVRILQDSIETWEIGSSLTRTGEASLDRALPESCIDAISSGQRIAATSRDGSSISVVDVPSTAVGTSVITGPEIAVARALIASRLAPLAAAGTNTAAVDVLPVTGSDPADDDVYGLVYPVQVQTGQKGRRVPLVTVNPSGQTSLVATLQLRPATMPVKLLASGSRIGVVYASGAVDWYIV